MVEDEGRIAAEVIAVEHAALDRWCRGDPSGFLEACATEVSYFDPFLGHRIDGKDRLQAYYEGLRGAVSAPQHEMIEPRVQYVGEVAVLTFRFDSTSSEGEQARWNCTEVYRRIGGDWSIIHTHWSFTRPS